MKVASLCSDLIKNRHYVFGLALQRGMPFIVIPLITRYFGQLVYVNYILLFSLVQFLALFIGLGTASAIIVFWHKYEDKNRYVSQFFLLLILLHLAVFVFFFPLLSRYLAILANAGVAHMAFFIALYVLVYNSSAVAASVLRAKNLPHLYFWAVLWSSLILVVFIYILGIFSTGLLGLLIAFTFTSFFQALTFLLFAKIRFKFFGLFLEFFSFSKEIITYSIPLMFYMFLTLSLITVDKWLIKLYLPQTFFSSYIYNFQFAYVVNLISIVLNMYTVPLFCGLINEKKYLSVKSKIQENYVLAIISSVLLSLVSYSYAMLTQIPLTKGYWLFSLAFLFCNLFAINVSFMEAARSAKSLFYLSLLPTFLFWLFFVVSLKFLPDVMIYFSFVFYYLFLILYSGRFISHWFKRRGVT